MRNRVVALTVSGLVLCAALVAGCSESKPRRAGRKLREAVDQAVAHYRAALGLVSNPYLRERDSGRPVSYLESPTEEKLSRYQSVSRRRINPEAPELLTKAEQLLDKAIQAHRDAPDADRALAHAMRGRVASLAGYCRSAVAERHRTDAARRLARAREVAGRIRTKSAVAEYAQEMLDRSNADVEAEIETAQERIEDLRAEIAGVEQAIADLKRRRDELIFANEALYGEARNDRVDSGLASGEKAVELLESALEAEAERYANEMEIARLEQRVERQQAEMARLEMELELARDRRDMAQRILDNRRSAVAEGDVEQGLEETRSRIEAETAEQRNRLGQIAAALEKASAAEAEAANAFERAAKNFEEAGRLAEDERSAAYTAQQADARLQEADVHRARVRMQERIASTLGSGSGVAQTPGASADVDKALGYLTDPSNVRQATAAAYEEAADLYARAARDDRDRRWAYQGGVATAYVMLYRFTGRAEHRDLAQEALAELEDVKASPHLRAVAEMEQMLEAQGG